MEVLPFDQYIVKVHGSGRLTRRNRRFLRAYVPAFEKEESGFPYSQDIDMGCESDSAWGARGHVTRSADSNNDPGGGPTDIGNGTQDTTFLDSQDDSQGADLDNSFGGRDFETGQSDTSSHSPNVELRRSTRSNRGKTSRFKDYLT